MIIGANRILQTKSVVTTSPEAVEKTVTAAKTLGTANVNRILNPAAIVPGASPQISPDRTAELPAIVKATEGINQGRSDGPLGTAPAGRLGAGTGALGNIPTFSDPDTGFDKPKFSGWPDWMSPVRIPGGEASTSPGSVIVSCVVGAAAGGKLGGPWGAAAGCAVGVASGIGQDRAAEAIDAFIDWIAGGAAPEEDVTTVPMGEPHDMGVPVDPKSDPNPDAEAKGGYSPKFAAPSLSWVNPVKPRPSEGDPIGIDANEPANVINILSVPAYGPAVDGNPDADPNRDGAAMKSILTSSDAVTDGRPDGGVQLQKLNNMRLANLMG